MLLFLNLLYLIHSVSYAGNSRSPAVLDSSCDLNIPSTNKPLMEIHLEQCKRVHQCMNSATDEEMPDLKKLETLVCKGDFLPVTTTVPSIQTNKAELNINTRQQKKLESEVIQNNTSTQATPK
jgi:hypothetical protein